MTIEKENKMIGCLIFISFIVLCQSDDSYILKNYPTESKSVGSGIPGSPCGSSHDGLPLEGSTLESLNQTKCIYNENLSLLKCKLAVSIDPSYSDFDQFNDKSVKILILYVHEFPMYFPPRRVVDLCFIDLFGSSLEEIAFCGFQPTINQQYNHTDLHILDVATLAAVAPDIETLFISGINLWQSVELRQFTSLKNLLIVQGDTIRMQYFHTAHCADCPGLHPLVGWSLHYLMELHSQLDYFLYDSDIPREACSFDLLKQVQNSSSPIPKLVMGSSFYESDSKAKICNTCKSGLCPLLAVCLDEKSEDRKDKEKPFECLCVEDLNVQNEFYFCDPMTLHLPMYSTRCNKKPALYKYFTLPVSLLLSYLLASLIVFIVSTIVLIKLR